MPQWFASLLNRSPKRWKEVLPDVDAQTIPIFARLAYLSSRSQEFHGQVLKPFGRRVSEYRLLSTLVIMGPLPPSQLSNILFQTPAGMTKTLDRLEKEHLIKRLRSPVDRRSVEIHLTKKGIAGASALMTAEAEAQSILIKDLSKQERKQLVRSFDLLIDNLG